MIKAIDRATAGYARASIAVVGSRVRNLPIEIEVMNYLLSKELSVNENIFCEVPKKDIPPEYILIEKTGSSRENLIDQAMIAIQSISKESLSAAMQLNEEVKEAMDEMAQLGEIFRCECNSDYNYTNTQTKEYRYQAVFNLFY